MADDQVARLKAKLVTMEEAAHRKQAELVEVEAVAAQVNPLKERVARLRQEVRERDELIERLKADALLRERKIAELNHVINDWKCKVGLAAAWILYCDMRASKLLLLGQAEGLIDDIRARPFKSIAASILLLLYIFVDPSESQAGMCQPGL